MEYDDNNLDDKVYNLEPLQKQLYNVLKLKNEDLAQRYISALQALSQSTNGDRFYHAACSIRDILVKLPTVIDIPIDNGASQSLNIFANNLLQERKKMLDNNRWPTDPNWQEDGGKSFKKLCVKIDAMVDGNIRIKKARQIVSQSIIRKQNFHVVPLPDDIESTRVKEWITYQDYFSAMTHCNPTNEIIFLNHLKHLEYFLLNCLEPRTFDIQEELQKIIEDGNLTPSKEHVTSALNKIQRTVEYEFFFEKLKSAGWVEVLDELKQFDKPSGIIREGNLVRFPFWPPARYLIRIASQKPEKVMQVILNVSPTDNSRVHEDFVEAALNMPPTIAVKLNKKVEEWLNLIGINCSILPSKVAGYIVHIKSGGFTKEALQIIDILLGVNPNKLTRKTELLVRNTWEYEESLKKFAPFFSKQDKFELIKLLSEKLRQVIIFEKGDNEEKCKDFSYIWRSSIEDSEQNHKYSIRDTIINCIRDLSEKLLIEAPELVESVSDYFRKRPFSIFSRFALHLVRLSQRPTLVSKFILDQCLFYSQNAWHEYALLIEVGYPILNEFDKKEFLKLVAVIGTKKEKVKGNQEDNEISKYLYYYMIRKYLIGEEKARFENLYDKFGELENPTFHFYIGKWIGPISPKSAYELKSIQIDALKVFLEEWKPKECMGGFSIEGLGRELENVVLTRSDEFIENINLFKVREKTYVRAIIQGFTKAFEQGKYLDWDKVIKFLVWASNQTDEFTDITCNLVQDKDPSWGWSRQAACRLIRQGLSSKTNEVPFHLREQVLKIISYSLSDIDPKAIEEDKYTSDNNYYQTAINSVRGAAFESIIYYVSWVKRNLGFSQEEELPVEKCPELFNILDCHLDMRIENSKSIRAMYGLYIPFLFSLNRGWFQKKVEIILPKDEEMKEYWMAAWGTNILYNYPSVNLFKELGEHYFLAIDRIDLNDIEKTGQKLMEHIIILFLNGAFGLEADIIKKLYSKIDFQLKRMAIGMIGRIIINKNEHPDPNIVERSIEFWNFRVDECKKMNEVKERIELIEFGWWMKSFQDEEWILDQSIVVLNLCHNITPDFLVLECLLNLVDKFPLKVATVLQLMVDYEVSETGFYGWLHQGEILFLKLLATPAQDIAVKTINKLGAYGFGQFGGLLKNKGY